jgi:L-lactate dehydrogenase complex protein LldG
MNSAPGARERILARLRAAPPAPSIAAPTLPVQQFAPADNETLIAQFRRGIELFHAEVIDTRGNGWRTALETVCTQKAIRTLLLPPREPQLSPWEGGPELVDFDRPIEDFKPELFNDIDAGLTIADGAVADTGTLIHADPARMPRTLSLVPPIHLCLLDVRRLHASLAAAVAACNWQAAMPSNLVFITGPSKTADIQQTLAYGAHGPKELIVLLTEDCA